MVCITTLITKDVVEVEFGLAGITQRQKRICQDCLHNHRFQYSDNAKMLKLNECVNDPFNVQNAN